MIKYTKKNGIFCHILTFITFVSFLTTSTEKRQPAIVLAVINAPLHYTNHDQLPNVEICMK